ncbi:MAG: hypothetical protein PHZ00_06715 [Candidatus Peribacteraceae bacterium]|nr:hypothetical protein [Candidatus Peribacteraceae bacterium]
MENCRVSEQLLGNFIDREQIPAALQSMGFTPQTLSDGATVAIKVGNEYRPLDLAATGSVRVDELAEAAKTARANYVNDHSPIAAVLTDGENKQEIPNVSSYTNFSREVDSLAQLTEPADYPDVDDGNSRFS